MELTRNGYPRVVITGVGTITSLGNFEQLGENLKNGVSGVRKLEFDAENMKLDRVDVHIASYIDTFDAAEYMDKKEIRRTARCSHYAIAASQIMLKDAGVSEDDLVRDSERSCVVVGTGLGGFEMLETAVTKFQTGEKRKPSPFAVAGGLINMPAHHVSVETKAVNTILPVTTACAAGSQALVHALEFIRLGRCDIAYAGGVEGAMHDYVLAGFGAMGALATGYNDNPTKASRPFDRERNGFVYGEGVTIFRLEKLENALKRDAKIYAELCGGASTSDAFHVTAMDEEAQGAYRSMNWAIQTAALNLGDIDYINAHGTSTPINDKFETKAIKRLFGEMAYEIPVSSTKSMTGHCQGSSGAIEVAACIHMLHDQVMHPTINYENPDPDCDLDYVPNVAREGELKYILSNNFGMGGQNASVVIGKI